MTSETGVWSFCVFENQQLLKTDEKLALCSTLLFQLRTFCINFERYQQSLFTFRRFSSRSRWSRTARTGSAPRCGWATESSSWPTYRGRATLCRYVACVQVPFEFCWSRSGCSNERCFGDKIKKLKLSCCYIKILK